MKAKLSPKMAKMEPMKARRAEFDMDLSYLSHDYSSPDFVKEQFKPLYDNGNRDEPAPYSPPPNVTPRSPKRRITIGGFIMAEPQFEMEKPKMSETDIKQAVFELQNACSMKQF